VVVGDSVHIAAVRRVSIGDNVLMGSRILITDHNHGIYRGTFQTDPNVPPQLRTLGEEGVVSIGRNVWLGDGVVVLPNTIIGDGSLVGANSVVSGEIPKHSIAVGAPAKVIRTFDTLTNHWICYSK
jgi:lipopolysaccharide O-acetyltransferase